MKPLTTWLKEYGESHQNPINRAIHKFAVPAITFSLLGLLWTLPRPEVFIQFSEDFGNWLNWATIFAFMCLIFYLRLSVRYAFIMLIVCGAMLGVQKTWLAQTEYQALANFIIFVVAWVFQFIGHKIEGKKPSFFQDIQFLLIGPIWVIHSLQKNSRKL